MSADSSDSTADARRAAPSIPPASARRTAGGPIAADSRPVRPPAAGVATLVLVVSALALGLTLLFAPARAALLLCAPVGLVGAAACEVFARLGLPGLRGGEPWRFDGWGVAVAGLGLLGLGLSVGPQASPLGWLLVALLLSLALAGFGAGHAD